MRAQVMRGILTLVAASTLHAATTFTFRNGAGGYTGSADVSINTQYAQYNGGNGVIWKNASPLGCYTTTGSGSYAVRYLLKFGNLSIPAGSQVTSASVAITFESWNAGPGSMTGFYLKNAWDPAFSQIGWKRRDASSNWASPGASSSGVDTVAGKSFQVPALKPVGVQTLTIPLDAAVVQSWIDTPAANQGIMLVNNLPGDIVRILSTVGSTNRRPVLTVVVSNVPAVTVSVTPVSASMQPGQTKQFTAAVTGNSNTAVTWTATGGTISASGLFTAGATAGSFAVTAKSAADPTKTATATVTVNPAVQVSVSPTTASLQPGQTKQFTATVMGNSNTAVTWTATGGTISASGLFTAGATAGSFAVTAKSVADPTKTATATVTVNPAVQVSVAPATASLQPGQTKQFTSTVTGTNNTTVTWTATGGTISSSGLYTAGTAAGSYSVTAKSLADPTKMASAAVTVNAIAVTVSPASATMQTGQTQQFTANVPVTWTATGGTISGAGLYTAGTTAGPYAVTAKSVADPTKMATATVTVTAAVQVSVSPTTATLQPAQTQQFTANVPVTWTATGGAISASGLFTAGTAAGAHTVTATSVADPTKTATATVTVTAITVTVSPATATVQAGQTQQFTSNVASTWTAMGGTISASGLFTAGSAAGSFTVRATSVADPTKFATGQVTVQPPVQISVSPSNVTVQPGLTQQFSAAVTGSTNTAVTWTATGGTITAAGLFTAGQNTGSFSVIAKPVADPAKSATATVQVDTGYPPVPRQYDGAYVVIQSPVSGMRFTAPASIRIYADPYVINAPDPDGHTVTFLMNGQTVGTYTGNAAQNGYYTLNLNSIAAGTYVLTARINTTQYGVVTSAPVTIHVDNPPAYGQTFNLTSDVVLSGSQIATYAGTAASRCAINGNGFQIRSAAGFTGVLNISNCDIRNLGTATNRAIDVTVGGAGSVQLMGNVFDTFGTVSLAANDQAQAIVRRNEFRANTLVPVGSQPVGIGSVTLPVFTAGGNSTTPKFFQGNNVGLSTVMFTNTRHWLIGGNTDAESNVLMGVRCGFVVSGSSNMVLRGNYSQHNYPHRFSQGQNFELFGDGFLVEHNVIRGSSWPVRGLGGEFRYNLVDQPGNSHSAIQSPMSNSRFHHNVFVYSTSQTLYGPESAMSVIYNVDNVQFHNNVMDGGGSFMAFYGNPMSVTSGSFLGSLRNNAFYNFASLAGGPAVAGALGESMNPAPQRLRYADYNAFFSPGAPNQTNYGLAVVGKTPGSAGFGLHDAGGFNGQVNPMFTQATAIPFPFKPEDIWNRTKKVSHVLAAYRTMYRPAPGSPLLGAGDPQDGPGGNIGAIGNGEPADQFGIFGNGAPTPSAPVIGSFAVTPASVQAGQSVTLNWSVTGADTLSIAPGPGAVTGSSVTITPSVNTTFTLTATNAGGFSAATATVTVIGGVPVTVSIAPASATVTTGQTRQFTATVGGTSNTAAVWTATGGTVSQSGLFTAGATPGSFSVTATSVQDSTKSASATVTVTPPQPVGVTVNPPTAMLYPNGTLQFAAAVANTTNQAVTWAATGGSISSTGLYTAGTATGPFTVTAASVQDPTKMASATLTIVTPTTTAHPRMILDQPTLAILRGRAQSNTQEWIALKSVCDSYLGGGTIYFPGQNGYPNRPSVGEGYQGSGYIEALMPLGLCYQTTLVANPALSAQYGAKAVAILMAMSDPNHVMVNGYPVFNRDYGYGIRNFGVAMGIGYDWFHALLAPAQKAQLQTSLHNWFSAFENDSFEYDHPQGNYFAGYYAAKCFAALAVQGDSPIGDAWWSDWYNHQHLQRVQPYYAANMDGGGWTEGFSQYGVLGSRNMALPALAVKTAKGMDLINAPQPYRFPLDQAKYLMAFTWPTRNMMDDRGELYNTESTAIWPGTPRLESYRFFAGFLAMWGDPLAPMMHKYARDMKPALDALNVGDSTDWVDFLFWDPNAPETADYTSLPLSYLAPGVGGVAARADWNTSAAFMTFMAGPYINFPSAGHEPFDKGSLAIQKDKRPLVVNPPAWLTHEPAGSPGWTVTFDDRFGNWNADRTLGNRTLYNTFQVRHLDASGSSQSVYGQWAMQRSDGARTKIGRYEDGGSYVLAVGTFLEDMYRPLQTACQGSSPITSWSRQILYLRPSQFVVYDRTGVCDASLDQHLAFHFPANPVEVASPATGVRRFDVNYGQFAGAMTTVLPANAATVTTDRFSSNTATWNKMWRTEIRPTGPATASRQWLTVFDVAGTSAQVAAAKPLTVSAGAAVGTVLQSAAGNTAAVFGTAPVGTPIAGTLTYVVPAGQTRHVITDLVPSTGYTVSVAVSGTNHVVSVTPGGSKQSTANGVLSFNVTAGGQMQP
jgi:hypothetical protein